LFNPQHHQIKQKRKKGTCFQAWWSTPVITACGRLSEFKYSLGYIDRPCLKKETKSIKSKQNRKPFIVPQLSMALDIGLSKILFVIG
jgi:hypothetical protein